MNREEAQEFFQTDDLVCVTPQQLIGIYANGREFKDSWIPREYVRFRE